jgi:hypothetical protein
VGAEAVCSIRFGGQVSEGKALLETTELVFRGGDFRLRIPFRQISALESADGELRVDWAQGSAVFELGRNAGVWAAKIRNPRGLLDKLGVKDGQRIGVLGLTDADFLSQLATRAAITSGLTDLDILFYEADAIADLERLPELATTLQPKGAVWVVSPKGKGAAVKDTDVMTAARGAGLVDTKVVSFSDTHTALRLVVPVAKRQPAAAKS